MNVIKKMERRLLADERERLYCFFFDAEGVVV